MKIEPISIAYKSMLVRSRRRGVAGAALKSQFVRHHGVVALVSARSGAAAVEFALVVPLFLLLLFGIIAYGLYLGTAHSVAQLAADAARVSVAGLSDAERAQLARAHVQRHAGGYAFVDPAKVTVAAGAAPGDATQFDVSVRFDSSALPIWLVAKIVPLPSKIITRTASIKRGGY